MKKTRTDRPQGHGRNTERQMMVIATCWLVLISVAYASVTLYMVDRLAEIKENAAIRHRARLDPTMVEVGRTPPEQAATNMGIEPKWRKVKAGMYVDRVSEFSTRDSRWGLDFYIWFVWSGDGIEPGETFHIIEGEITDSDFRPGTTTAGNTMPSTASAQRSQRTSVPLVSPAMTTF